VSSAPPSSPRTAPASPAHNPPAPGLRSDGLVHDVEPLRIASEADHRWALTTWHLAADPAADRSLAQGLDPWLDVRHFGAPLTSLTAPARRLATRSLADACGRALQVMTRR